LVRQFLEWCFRRTSKSYCGARGSTFQQIKRTEGRGRPRELRASRRGGDTDFDGKWDKIYFMHKLFVCLVKILLHFTTNKHLC
jgi:hypothetical protein